MNIFLDNVVFSMGEWNGMEWDLKYKIIKYSKKIIR